MSVLVTGIIGFIGSEVEKVLISRNIEIHPSSYFLDLRSFPDSELDGVTSVIHLASAGVNTKNRDWATCMAVNVNGSFDLVRRCRKLEIPILSARSFMEDALQDFPSLKSDPYFSTKSLFHNISSKWGCNIRFIRIFQVYGPKSFGVLDYARKCFIYGSPAVFGSCVGPRDWIHVSDVATAIVDVWEQQTPHLSEWDAGSGELVPIRIVVEMIHSKLFSISTMNFDPDKDRPDTAVRLKAERFPIGWRPKVLLEDGIREFCSRAFLQ